MRHVRRLVITALVATTVVVTQGRDATACVCVAGTDAGSFANSDVVFVGTALESGPSPYSSVPVDPWTFRVESVQKGPQHPEFLVHTGSAEVTTLHGGKRGVAVSSCGYRVDRGRRYQIFAKVRGPDRLETGSCSANRELAAIGAPPDSNRAQQAAPYWPPSEPTAGLIVFGTSLAALAAAVVMSRRFGSTR